MRGVLVQVTEEDLARRRERGLDRRDEMWEGEIHMSPAPSDEHQRILSELIAFLMPLLRKRGRGTLRPGINVFRKDDDYRIPDLTFVAAGREKILAPDGIRGGAPDAVIEIRSPDDETYEKLPWYAKLGCRETIVLHRDTKAPEVFRLAGAAYVAVSADRDGWVTSETLRCRFRRASGETPRLQIEDLDDPRERVEI